MSGKLGWGARLVRQNVRRFTTSQKRFVSREEVEKIKKKQEEYQRRSAQNEPIHMIAGKTHFYITTVLGILTAIYSARSLYRVVNHK